MKNIQTKLGLVLLTVQLEYILFLYANQFQ